ncbi:MAG: hypothetical protein ACD_13C00021G0014 [uncultured bacterium]|uniref:D-aminoacyl-tRNA deacylase n=1 Tax=Candidatus Woesebacteria bacterium GW2011_GWA1_40_43 TaxID=1618553 RepID=A0A0G0SBP2_9BACT|nr:MAG: hypothetical protein ACD_13C00021G0014 [uncultured bacterium]KKR52912.1 MAG: D-tyrosyl-tRNA(Tyr) deacylase [Candidatus Woesebacteria bacterium GW2011_GWD2_40_19]KKR56442.1 MAG: D-tyrosyl-tRNA(Tyr) deacylase [Candidatus Woesebacteria bacterium GW2011_GWC2_40_30]KKR62274.1 MAG: D-tyrosyl-tRNA(Tyr) deacylase [Candidatus Woesebacteria bacterium GW2011_GWA1_40_43]HAU64996.1 D-tyrosyl-tRNA(Tyr) deacylase [Candidatus Woesebacteria bacterium]
MKIIVQRVKEAKVVLIPDQRVVGKIGEGLFVLVGFKKGDTEKEVAMLAEKLSKLRVMKDGEKKMNLSVKEIGASVLVVSQFTLYADTKGGNRPSFINAEDPVRARQLYELFVNKLKEKDIKVETGSFGDYMQIETVMDGPVTIVYSD